MPLQKGQLAQQRRYIKGNPRSRLLRSTHRDLLQPRRGGIDTAMSVKALMGYLERECAPSQLTPETKSLIASRLLTTAQANHSHPQTATQANLPTSGRIYCDSYGDRQLLQRPLLPVVCHRRDAALHGQQKAQCLLAARQGAVLVSARIAKGEQDIIDEAVAEGFPVILVMDNGFPDIYHPSEERMTLCLTGRLLLTPWQYHYRQTEETISVAVCKTMNGVAQALCHTADGWWRNGEPLLKKEA